MSNIVPLRKNVRLDNFRNLITGYGTSRDHGEGFEYYKDDTLQTQKLENIYTDHPLAWKIVDYLPDDAMREGFDIEADNEEQLEETLKQINFCPVLTEGLKMARLHGGAALYIDTDGDPAEPLTAGPHDIYSIEIIEKDYIYPVGGIKRSLRAEYWEIYTDDSAAQRIHESRLIIIRGDSLPRNEMVRLGGWGGSALQRCYRPLMAYSIVHNLVPNIVKDFIRDVIKINGLADLAINDCESDRRAFNDRLDAMFLAQSTINKLVLDKDDDIIRQVTSLGGLNDLIRNPEKALAAASGIPHTKLFGESPGAALSQSGSSQEKDWHKTVAAYQESRVRPAIQRVLEILTGQMVKFRFNPLDVPSTAEQAATLNAVADAVSKLIAAQVITPTEAAEMFAGEELKMLPKIDIESRAEMAQFGGYNGNEEES